MKNPSGPIYQKQDVVTATPARLGTAVAKRLLRIDLYCTVDGKVTVKNGNTDTGDVLYTAEGLAKTTPNFDLTNVGGIPFSVGCFVTVTGTGNIAHCWYEE